MWNSRCLLPAAAWALLTLPGCGPDHQTPVQPAATLSDVHGSIRDVRSHAPIAGASVTVGARTAVSDSAGAFAVDSVDVGWTSLTVLAPGYRRFGRDLQVSGPDQLLDIDLPAARAQVIFQLSLAPSQYVSYLVNPACDSYFRPDGSGYGPHNVFLSVRVTAAGGPFYLALVRPDGQYVLEDSAARAALADSFLTNACGNWGVVCRGPTSGPLSATVEVACDYSLYLPPANDLAPSVVVPLNEPAIGPGERPTVSRFLQAGLHYALTLTVTGGSADDIDLEITDPSGADVFHGTISGFYLGTAWTAPRAGIYTLVFAHPATDREDRAVTGSLNIAR